MAENNSLLGLKIMDVLRNYSDENHTLNQKDIIDILKNSYNTVVDRKTINRNMETLIAYDEMNGSHIQYELQKRITGGEEMEVRKNFYYDSELTDGEARILLDSVYSNRNVSVKHSRELIKKITDLRSRHFKTSIGNISFYDDVYKQDVPDLFYNIEEIGRAIEEEKNVFFTLGEYDEHLKLVESRRFILTPLQLFMYNQTHYLLAAQPERLMKKETSVDFISKHIRIIPVADILSLSIRERTDNHSKELFDRLKSRINYAKLLGLSPYMEDIFSTETEKIRFVIPKQKLKDVVTRFGQNIEVEAIPGSCWKRAVGQSQKENPLMKVSVKTTHGAMKRFMNEHRDHIYVIEPASMNYSGTDVRDFEEFKNSIRNSIGDEDRAMKAALGRNDYHIRAVEVNKSALSDEEKETMLRLLRKMYDPDREWNFRIKDKVSRERTPDEWKKLQERRDRSAERNAERRKSRKENN